MKHLFDFRVFALLALLGAPASSLCAAEWPVPVAGNAFRTAPQPSGEGFRRGGGIAWKDPAAVYSIFFHVDRAADLRLALRARANEGGSQLQVQVGKEEFQSSIEGQDLATHEVGAVKIKKAGYVRVDIRIAKMEGANHTEVRDLIVSSDTEGLQLDCVKSNKGNMYYWGRRGPSVHLRYEVPRGPKIQYAYSEVTVPKGQDAIGTFFMANGFGEGYFGFQVNSATERRVLFSVWSPFKTDNPRDIPKDQRIVALGKGPEVRIGEFGNEGSGGQSRLIYPWKAGATYRFLTEVKPDGKGNTIYTSWFGDKSKDEWRLIASFQRPKTDTHLRGFHSFLESFSPTFGYQGRQAQYGNVWVRDFDGQWHECSRARFSVDATGRGRHRLDFTGGAEGKHFFLRNCGFFDETGRPGDTFVRDSTSTERPDIDFDQMPRR